MPEWKAAIVLCSNITLLLWKKLSWTELKEHWAGLRNRIERIGALYNKETAFSPFTINLWDCVYEYNMGAGVELSYTWAQTKKQMGPLSFSYTSLFCILWRRLTVDHIDPGCRSRCKSSLRRSTPAHNHYNGTGKPDGCVFCYMYGTMGSVPFHRAQNLENSRAQPSPTSPRNGYASIQKIMHGAVSIICA